jgi:hypothetical protein
MEDKRATPPLDDVRFFQDIAADIQRGPRYYRDAGKWLDKNYSDAAFAKMERAEWTERLRKAKTGQIPEAEAVIRALERMRKDKVGTMRVEEAGQLVPELARRNVAMSESRLAEIQAKDRTGHLAPDADLRPLTPEEKAKWPAMSGAERQELSRRMALTTEQKKQRDTEREELHAVDTERNRLIRLVTGYYLGEGHQPYYEIQQTYRKWRVRKSFLMVRRFLEATLPFRKDPPAFPTVTESKQILLMTWLMTDHRADKWGLGLTEFEKWPWDVAGQHPVHGRRYASNWWLFPSTEYTDWVALARRAWETAKVDSVAHAPAAPPADRSGTEGVAGRRRTNQDAVPPRFLTFSEARELIYQLNGVACSIGKSTFSELFKEGKAWPKGLPKITPKGPRLRDARVYLRKQVEKFAAAWKKRKQQM